NYASGQPAAQETAIFTNEKGEPMRDFRNAWRGALERAGITDIRWHDLRHEYASRLVEKGVPLSQVRDLLGHASITTTERYDNQKLENLQAAVLKLEKGESFDTNDPRAQKALDDRDKVSSFFQDQAKVSGIE